MFRKYVFALSILSLLVMGQTVTARAADACQPVYNALAKIVTTPSHSYSTQTAPLVNGQQRKVETIYVQGKTYMLASGKWMVSPATPNDVLQQELENEKQGKSTCQFVRNESVNGEAAAVYSMRRETEIANENGLIWISKTSGLALKKEVDMEYGGKVGKMHLVARYEYSNVKAPM
ncbi:MAG TPA: hypothetical protein VFA90_09385 [Terriglobales bacterium]|nr:hypothetical protein [Terriglobales bacterium]